MDEIGSKNPFGRLSPLGRASWAAGNCKDRKHPLQDQVICHRCAAEAINLTLEGGIKLAGDINDEAVKLEIGGREWKTKYETEFELRRKAAGALADALLQVRELKAALYAECKGEACHPEECCGGYRQCTGCEARAKKAYGPGWGEVTEKQEGKS